MKMRQRRRQTAAYLTRPIALEVFSIRRREREAVAMIKKSIRDHLRWYEGKPISRQTVEGVANAVLQTMEGLTRRPKVTMSIDPNDPSVMIAEFIV